MVFIGNKAQRGQETCLKAHSQQGAELRIKIKSSGTSLVAQQLRILLSTQGTQVQALVREDPTCHEATKPVHHNY